MDWISIKDECPKPGDEVFTYHPTAKWYSCFNAACWDGEDFWFDELGSPIHGISHWMPLPKPPTDCLPESTESLPKHMEIK